METYIVLFYNWILGDEFSSDKVTSKKWVKLSVFKINLYHGGQDEWFDFFLMFAFFICSLETVIVSLYSWLKIIGFI